MPYQLRVASCFVLGVVGLVACGDGTPNLRNADEAVQTLADSLSYPEGPAWLDGKLYFVEFGADQVSVLDGDKRAVWTQKGCGPAALLAAGAGELWVSCYDQNALWRIDTQGRTLETISRDTAGNTFVGPNDFAADGKGGFYFSASGVFDTAAPVTGKVMHRAASGALRVVAEGLHYPNGLALVDGGRGLLVNQHLARRIERFDVQKDGGLSGGRAWKTLAELTPDAPGADGYTGPDGLKADARGNLYVCEYGAGRILVVSPRGALLRTLAVPARYVTNVAIAPSGKSAYVTAATDTAAPPFPGAVYELALH